MTSACFLVRGLGSVAPPAPYLGASGCSAPPVPQQEATLSRQPLSTPPFCPVDKEGTVLRGTQCEPGGLCWVMGACPGPVLSHEWRLSSAHVEGPSGHGAQQGPGNKASACELPDGTAL